MKHPHITSGSHPRTKDIHSMTQRKNIIFKPKRSNDAFCNMVQHENSLPSDTNTPSSAFVDELKLQYGFDICHEFNPSWYNDSIQEEGLKLRLLKLSQLTTTTSTAFLIGNSKYMWPYFIRWYERQQQHQQHSRDDNVLQQNPSVRPTDKNEKQGESECYESINDNCDNDNDDDDDNNNDVFDIVSHPLDTYTKESIKLAVAKCFSNNKYRIHWSCNETSKDLVAMQRVALVSGLVYHGKEVVFCIHPIYGTWHSFRAVVVVDLAVVDQSSLSSSTQSNSSIPTTGPPCRVPCLLSNAEKERAKIAMQYAITVSSSNDNDLTLVHNGKITEDDDDNNDDTNHEMRIVRAWVAVRDCVDTGRSGYRYGHNQLNYHYTKNTSKYLQCD